MKELEELERALQPLSFENKIKILEPVIEAKRKLESCMTEPMTMAQFEQLLFDWNG